MNLGGSLRIPDSGREVESVPVKVGQSGVGGPLTVDQNSPGRVRNRFMSSSLSCTSRSISGPATDSCSVNLNTAAPNGGLTLTLSSNDPAVTVPASVTVAAKATSASFTAGVASVSSSQTATITGSSATETASITLQLTPTAAVSLSANATSISFGSVVINTPVTQTITLTSSGTAAVTVSSASIAGAGFSVTGTKLPVTLNAGQTATLAVEFDPAATGAASGQLTITNSSSNATIVIALSGTCMPHEVALAWLAPVDSPVSITGYDVYRANEGSSSYQLLNSSLIGETNYTDITGQSGASYQYYVASVDAAGVQSTPSNTVSVTIP
jgi:hypothetical protein